MSRTFANKEGELDTLTCQVEAGEIAAGGDDGLDVRIFAKDIPPADPRQGVRAEMRAEIHLPEPIITDVVKPGRKKWCGGGASDAPGLRRAAAASGNVTELVTAITCTPP